MWLSDKDLINTLMAFIFTHTHTHTCFFVLCRKRRLDFLHDLRWTQGTLPDHVKANVTPQELDFFKGYSKLLGQYMRSIELGGVGLDLTAVCIFYQGHSPELESACC